MPAGQTRFESRGIIEGRKSKKWIPKPEFCFAHSSISSFYRGSCARDISGWIEHELGDGEDMDRFAILARSIHTEFQRRPQHAFFGLSYEVNVDFSIISLRAL